MKYNDNLSKWTIIGFITALVILLPSFINNLYHIHILIMVFYYTFLASGWRFIMNIGYVNFGFPGFIAIGSYTAALLVTKCGWTFWLAAPVAGVIGGMIGLVIGYPLLRIKATYFFIATVSFVGVVEGLLYYWESFTGGWAGIKGIPRPSTIDVFGLLTLKFSSKIHFYYLIVILVILILLILYRIERSDTGKVIFAIKDSNNLASSIGINITGYKMAVFAASCSIASIGGAFFAFYNTMVTPNIYDFNLGVQILIVVMFGGIDLLLGPLVGAFLLITISELIRFSPQWHLVIWGSTLILVMLFLRGGVVTPFLSVARRLRFNQFKTK